MSRSDYFCEDYSEFGEVLADMAREAEELAIATPTDGLFLGYSDRLFAIARELTAIDGGLRAAIAVVNT